MKLNSNTRIIGRKLILVPYEKHHVPRYHEWMKSEELQQLTASEPLSLDEEYKMQLSWREDENKCTFIILDKNLYERQKNEIDSMIGDTNIFITDHETSRKGEIEIMIAEKCARGKKLGWEAVILMLLYGIKFVKLEQYEAKISLNNEISIKMFKKLGFEEIIKSDIFQEITLQKNVDISWEKWLDTQLSYVVNVN